LHRHIDIQGVQLAELTAVACQKLSVHVFVNQGPQCTFTLKNSPDNSSDIPLVFPTSMIVPPLDIPPENPRHSP